jgi:alpha-amylase/alpha-mannosidase (GH57 family)
MHQPYYLDAESNQYQLPWTYLHAIKDYVDMAALVEMTPGARAVVNFTPTLLEQIEDYTNQIRNYLHRGEALRDPLLAALSTVAMPSHDEERIYLVKSCLRVNEKHLVNRFEPYRLLADMAAFLEEKPHTVRFLSTQYLADIVVWYHLAWLGETVRRNDERVKALIEKGNGFSQHDRLVLLTVIGELIEGVIGRYRRLVDDGKLELSVTPYAHPIIPLMLDLQSASDAMPDVHLPVLDDYPGGRERVQWHIDKGFEVFERHFGFRPAGCWPSEGSVSRETLKCLQENGFKWAASGETVLRNSLARSEIHDVSCIHRPFHVSDNSLACFFRDDDISDAIGFNYADWHADDAVGDLISKLQYIAHACQDEPGRVVSIILDGENAWEYYPANGYYFLSALYRRLADHPDIELTTFSEALAKGVEPKLLPELVAGSWVYGTFSTWIGDEDKNRGWELLGDAKRTFDRVVQSGELTDVQLKAAEHQLAICEGSDWFWWFGDYNPSDSVRDFDRLFRLQLAHLYRLLGKEVPEHLATTISYGGSGSTAETGGVMRRGQ